MVTHRGEKILSHSGSVPALSSRLKGLPFPLNRIAHDRLLVRQSVKAKQRAWFAPTCHKLCWTQGTQKGTIRVSSFAADRNAKRILKIFALENRKGCDLG